jgi:hypothetical protein
LRDLNNITNLIFKLKKFYLFKIFVQRTSSVNFNIRINSSFKFTYKIKKLVSNEFKNLLCILHLFFKIDKIKNILFLDNYDKTFHCKFIVDTFILICLILMITKLYIINL